MCLAVSWLTRHAYWAPKATAEGWGHNNPKTLMDCALFVTGMVLVIALRLNIADFVSISEHVYAYLWPQVVTDGDGTYKNWHLRARGGMCARQRGNVCPARAQRATFLLTIPTN